MPPSLKPTMVMVQKTHFNLVSCLAWMVFWVTLPFFIADWIGGTSVAFSVASILVLSGLRIVLGAPWRNVTTFLVPMEKLQQFLADTKVR